MEVVMLHFDVAWVLKRENNTPQPSLLIDDVLVWGPYIIIIEQDNTYYDDE